MNVPSLSDWGDISDRDISYAYENFGGKSNEEMQNKFKENIHERCINLSWMPIKPFVYYIYGLKQFIERGDFGLFAKASSANWFFDLVLSRATKHPLEIQNIYQDLLPIMKDISNNQSLFELDEDIYGDFHEKFNEISAVLKSRGQS